MNNIRIIPRLDIKGRDLIKSIQFEGLRKLGDPANFAKKYYDEGADELLYMDIVASLYGRNNLFELIAKVTKKIFIPFTVGGGIRSIEEARKIFCSGADKIAINSAAVKNPKFISKLANKFGSQSIIVSIEAKKIKNKWEALIEHGRERTGLDALSWAKRTEELGAGEILLTSVDKEGTGRGFDMELIKEIQKKIKIPLIVCGGMSDPKDLLELNNYEVSAVSMSNILHYNKFGIKQIKNCAKKNNLNVRSI